MCGLDAGSSLSGAVFRLGCWRRGLPLLALVPPPGAECGERAGHAERDAGPQNGAVILMEEVDELAPIVVEFLGFLHAGVELRRPGRGGAEVFQPLGAQPLPSLLPLGLRGDRLAPFRLQQRTQAGPVWAVVTAEPTSTTWDPGDGSVPFTCAGPGTAYSLFAAMALL